MRPEQTAAARALKPMHERQVFGRSVFLFDRADRAQTRRARRSAHAQHRRPVRRHDRRSARSRSMNAATEADRELRWHPPTAPRRSRPFYWLGAARAVGEPLALHRAARRRRRRLRRLSPQRDASAGRHAVAVRRSIPSASARSVTGIYGGIGVADRVHDGDHDVVLRCSMRCTASAAIAAFCSGNRCRCPTPRRCCQQAVHGDGRRAG